MKNLTFILFLFTTSISAQKTDIYGLPVLPKPTYAKINTFAVNTNLIDHRIKSETNTEKTQCIVYLSGEIIFEIKISSIKRELEEGVPITYYFGIDKGDNVIFKGYNYVLGVDSFYNIRVERLKETKINNLVKNK